MKTTAQEAFWTGRLSLQVQSDPPQSFSAGFELQGSPEQGQLTLRSPLGNTLAVASWSPTGAQLQTSGPPRAYASLDTLMESTTGAAVPLASLFSWLRGENAAAEGWEPDLSRASEGRINARRIAPLPAAQLRVVVEK